MHEIMADSSVMRCQENPFDEMQARHNSCPVEWAGGCGGGGHAGGGEPRGLAGAGRVGRDMCPFDEMRCFRDIGGHTASSGAMCDRPKGQHRCAPIRTPSAMKV